jgi:ABC-type transport system substrate-binding protein
LQALELLFEALVHAKPTRDGSQVYFPQLAAALPEAADSERAFSVRKNAFWSSGARVTSTDVQRTFELLTSPKLAGRSLELADQFEPLRSGSSPFHWSVKLQKGLLEPLLPFTFKVLPREYQGAPLVNANSEAFAKAPVGSGRYMLAEHNSNVMRFVANPYYVGRNEPEGPKIREVHLVVCTDPVADFANKNTPLHVLVDVDHQAAGKLKSAGLARVRTLPTRRVFFLAVNHREPILANEALRRALAHGLNRDQILADSFGGGRPSFRTGAIAAWGSMSPVIAAVRAPAGGAAHRSLNGPFPPGSWACNPEVPANLLDRARAVTFLKKVGTSDINFELKYPDDDPRVAQACQAIAIQLANLGSQAGCTIKLRLVARSPHDLQHDLQTHQYQLAYWHYDFPSDAYSLWPLFDPRPEALANGSNYLGFKDKEGSLPALLLQAASHRDFNEIKRPTHLFHLLFADRMPLIPLWQFECTIAVHTGFDLPPLDPLRIFANIDEWPLPPGR